MNIEPRSLADRLIAASIRVHAKQAPTWAVLKELKDAGAAAEEHGLLLIEQISSLFSSVDDDTAATAYQALGDTIAELAVLAHLGLEARNYALSRISTAAETEALEGATDEGR